MGPVFEFTRLGVGGRRGGPFRATLFWNGRVPESTRHRDRANCYHINLLLLYGFFCDDDDDGDDDDDALPPFVKLIHGAPGGLGRT